MFQYTTDPTGDRTVEKDLEIIRKAVKGKEFDSILLFGSYARGEGIVIDGKARNDYDIIVLGSEEAQQAVANAKTSVKCEVHTEIGQGQQLFEIIHAHKVIAGNIPEFKPMEAWEIPFADAINSLERRSVSMIVAKYEMGKENPDTRKVTEQIAKGIISIGDAVLIKRGQFHPRYSVRSLMLSQDDIGGLYSLAVSMKLLNMPEVTQDKLWELWHTARKKMREFAVENQLQLQVGELLFSITDRTTQEDLGLLLDKLGAGEWK